MYSYSINKKLVLSALLLASVSVMANDAAKTTNESSVTQAENEAATEDAKMQEDSVKLDEAAKATAALIAATLSNGSMQAPSTNTSEANLAQTDKALEDNSGEAIVSEITKEETASSESELARLSVKETAAEIEPATEIETAAATENLADDTVAEEANNEPDEVDTLIAKTSTEGDKQTSDTQDTPEQTASITQTLIASSESTIQIEETKPTERQLPTAAMPAPVAEPASAVGIASSVSSATAAVTTSAATLSSAPSSSAIADNASSTQMNTQSCPNDFFEVKLPQDGKLCQVFAADLPASMILFVPQTPEQVIQFYQQDADSFSTSRQVKDRFMLQSDDKNKTVIISADGQGTQIDILVKS